ncbi:MAG: hypothetical protein RIG62_17740 [Cyclobacteriaceae bacterium]
MIQVFHGKTCQAVYDSENDRMLYSFNGYAVIDEHKAMYRKTMEFAKEHKVVSFMMDFRAMKGTFTFLNDWVIQTLTPAVALGLKKGAMVLNEDIFTAFSANDAISKVTLIQLQVFEDPEEARHWLERP